MAIDLTTLNTTEIIPQKVYNLNNSYKADQNKIRENWEEKKATAIDLIEESKKNDTEGALLFHATSRNLLRR